MEISAGDVTLYAVWLRSTSGGGTGTGTGGSTIGKNPKTGDTSAAIYGVILGVSALALVGTGVVIWKKRSTK